MATIMIWLVLAAQMGATIVGRFYDMHLPGKYLIQISQKDLENGQVVKSNQIEVTVDPPEAPE